MTSAQHNELQHIIDYFNTLDLVQVEAAFTERWQPFVLSLSTEEARVEAFQLFYEWQIKQMKTKWGTCNIEKKRMWLNLELAKKPLHCLEYIIVHEMVHLLERHHNEQFLRYMNTFLPHWKQIKEELNALPLSHADWKEDLSTASEIHEAS